MHYDRSARAPLLYVTGGYALAARKAGAVSTEAAAAWATPTPKTCWATLLGRAHFQFMAGFRRARSTSGGCRMPISSCSLLSVRDGFRPAEIATHIACTGIDIGAVALRSLADRGFDAAALAEGRHVLKEAGSDAILHVLAAAKVGGGGSGRPAGRIRSWRAQPAQAAPSWPAIRLPKLGRCGRARRRPR